MDITASHRPKAWLATLRDPADATGLQESCMSPRPINVISPPSMRAVLAACLVSGGLLLACTPDTGLPRDPPASPAPAPAPAAGDAGRPAEMPTPRPDPGTVGGDGSQIALVPLDATDSEAVGLEGELACSFTSDGAQPLLYAMGVVGSDAPAQGAVRVAGHVEQVRAPGGFDGMVRNPVFQGRGKTIRIEQSGAASAGGESPAHPATLTYLRADGAHRVFEGQWQCGP